MSRPPPPLSILSLENTEELGFSKNKAGVTLEFQSSGEGSGVYSDPQFLSLPSPKCCHFCFQGQRESRCSICQGLKCCKPRSFLSSPAVVGGGESTTPLRHRLLKKLGQEAPPAP